ncbi:unnamed protein product [Polarella glacialis]|uniref:Large ribosomal subunit protein bL31c n=1 Tax=Polarella glacialis TaxID=89957 RepID=A0A813IIP2_POLGL|nr:unnamed protein product [Polarella glacialis]
MAPKAEARRSSKGVLAVALAVVALWASGGAISGAVAFVAAATGISRQSASRDLVARNAGRDWRPGNEMKKVDFKAAAEQSRLAKAKKSGAGSKDVVKLLPTIHMQSEVIYNGEKVAVLNGTLALYKVDIWSGAHPVWQGKKGKVLLDASSLTKFQEKYGAASSIYGDLGLDQVKMNEQLRKKQDEMKAAGLKVY